MGRCPVSELLELLLGASGLGDLEHVEAHGLAQGPALTHRDNIANLDVPVEVGSGRVMGVGRIPLRVSFVVTRLRPLRFGSTKAQASSHFQFHPGLGHVLGTRLNAVQRPFQGPLRTKDIHPSSPF